MKTVDFYNQIKDLEHTKDTIVLFTTKHIPFDAIDYSFNILYLNPKLLLKKLTPHTMSQQKDDTVKVRWIDVSDEEAYERLKIVSIYRHDIVHKHLGTIYKVDVEIKACVFDFTHLDLYQIMGIKDRQYLVDSGYCKYLRDWIDTARFMSTEYGELDIYNNNGEKFDGKPCYAVDKIDICYDQIEDIYIFQV